MFILKIILLLFATVADIYLFRIGVLPLEPSLFLLPIFTFIFIFKCNIAFINTVRKRIAFKFFFTLIIISALYSPISIYDNSIETLGIHCYTFIIYIIAAFIFSKSTTKFTLYFFIMSFCVLSFSIIIDLAGILNSGKLIVRGAGFAENPNSAAQRLLFIGLIIIYLLEHTRHRILFLIILGGITFLTLSRSGIIGYFIVMILLLSSNYSNYLQSFNIKKLFKALLGLALILLVFIYILPLIANIFPGMQTNAAKKRIERLTFQSEIISEGDTSNEGRVTIFKTYFNDFIENPFGYGAGASVSKNMHSFATHNLYIRLAIDYGILGLLLFLFFLLYGILYGIKTNNTQLVLFFVLLSVFAPFTNTLLENRTFIISLAALEALIYKLSQIKSTKYVKN